MTRTGTAPGELGGSAPRDPTHGDLAPHVGQATIITAQSRGVRLDMGELWEYRELFQFLIWRTLKVRYRQTIFGVAWAVLQPVVLMAVFTLALGRLAGIHPGTVPYAPFVLAALVPWTFVSQGLTGASASLVDSANLLQKIYFPRLLLPLAAIGSYILDLAIALVILFAVLIWSGIPPTVSWAATIPLAGLAVAIAAAFGISLAAINVRYRDVRHALPFLMQILLFASPIVYSASAVPAGWQPIYRLNPITGLVEGFRWALFGEGPAPVESLATAVIVTGVALVVGLVYFGRVERSFADVI